MGLFVSKLSADGSGFIYSTYLGGDHTDEDPDIAIDGLGQAYVVGETESTNFPLANAAQTKFAGGLADLFVAKISADGSGTTVFLVFRR